MRYVLLLLLGLYASTACALERVDSVRYRYARRAPAHAPLSQLVAYLAKGAQDKKKVVETFCYWMSVNIRYDPVLRDKPGVTAEEVSAEAVLRTRKTVCAGYSQLLLAMCQLAQIECVIINGTAQDYIGPETYQLNHAWNAVKVAGSWQLVDATWSSGGLLLGSDEYSEKLEVKYLFADPAFFAIDHYPEDPKWQLLPMPITLAQFHGPEWKQKRFRKFNDLLDDQDYQGYLESTKEEDAPSGP